MNNFKENDDVLYKDDNDNLHFARVIGLRESDEKVNIDYNNLWVEPTTLDKEDNSEFSSFNLTTLQAVLLASTHKDQYDKVLQKLLKDWGNVYKLYRQQNVIVIETEASISVSFQLQLKEAMDRVDISLATMTLTNGRLDFLFQVPFTREEFVYDIE